MERQKSHFGNTANGQSVDKYLLRSSQTECEIVSYGAAIVSLRVPDRGGGPVNVVLGYESIAEYEKNCAYLGATVGRYANRISHARCPIGNKICQLTPNEGENQLHGGSDGFSYQVFAVKEMSESSISLSYTEPDGKNGFPGNLSLTVTYELQENGLMIRYEALSDKDTVCNITNHSYFNLNGGGDAMGHLLWLDAEEYLPIGEGNIPLGEIRSVKGTPFDFAHEKVIRPDLMSEDPQLRIAGGYDHCFLLSEKKGLRCAARMTGERPGIVMECWTDRPALQLYTANCLNTSASTESGCRFSPRQAVCLETELPPDSPNHPEWGFGSGILKRGQLFETTTVYRFLAINGK